MTIASLEATVVALPLSKPTTIATRALNERLYLLVTVKSTDGATGVGYCYVGTAGGRTAVAATEELLKPVYLGANEDDIEGLWRRAYQETLLTGRRGVVLRALSAIDIALWDLKGKVLAAPLATLLGGPAGGTLPAYASGGYYRSGEDPVEAVKEEIAFNRSQGFADHKIKVGGSSINGDAARVKAAIEAIDGTGRLAIDANNAYRSVAEAEVAARAFDAAAGDQELWWFEEPLSPDDLDGHRLLGSRLPMAVATGEIHQSRWELASLLRQPGVSILQIDAGVIGGITEWMRVARAAEVFGIAVAPHWHHNLHVHLGAAVPGTLAIEHFAIEKGIYNFEELLTPETRLVFGGNTVTVPTRPGLGIEFDPEIVEKYRIDQN